MSPARVIFDVEDSFALTLTAALVCTSLGARTGDDHVGTRDIPRSSAASENGH